MKGSLSADRLFFISALASVASFVIYNFIMYIWPVPMDPMVPYSPTSPDAILNTASWALAWAGVVTFVLGFVARKN